MDQSYGDGRVNLTLPPDWESCLSIPVRFTVTVHSLTVTVHSCAIFLTSVRYRTWPVYVISNNRPASTYIRLAIIRSLTRSPEDHATSSGRLKKVALLQRLAILLTTVNVLVVLSVSIDGNQIVCANVRRCDQ